MDDGCAGLIATIVGILIAIYAVLIALKYVLGGIYAAILFISANFFYLFDNLLFRSGYSQPVIFWGLFGLVMGAAAGLVISGYKYRVPILKPMGISVAVLVILVLVLNRPTLY